MVFTRKHLLEWMSSHYVERSKQKSLFRSYIFMWIEPGYWNGGILLFKAVHLLQTLNVAGPILTLWIVAPSLPGGEQALTTPGS